MRLPALLKQHQPRWVLIERGGNDGLRGFPLQNIEQNLSKIITLVKAANAQPLLMQIRLPANYGRRYTEAFSEIHPKLTKEFAIPLVLFMGQVYQTPKWMQSDGIHPSAAAQPFITELLDKELAPLVKHE